MGIRAISSHGFEDPRQADFMNGQRGVLHIWNGCGIMELLGFGSVDGSVVLYQ